MGADNNYGHPSPEILDTLADMGTRVLCTDVGGDLAVAATAGGPAVVVRGDPREAL